MISVILATHNGEKYIDLAIESVLNQSFKYFELLIGFNGTTDNSKEIINKYNNDKRIRIFDYGDDKGKSRTLNKLLNECKYDWVALQDDDDFWIHTKLEKQIECINSYDVIGTFINYIDKDGHIIGNPILSSYHDDIVHLSMSGRNQIANSSSLFKRSVALEIGGWREDLDTLVEKGYQPLEDYDFWIRLMKAGKKFINIPEQLVLHRLHSNSNFNTKKYDLSKIL